MTYISRQSKRPSISRRISSTSPRASPCITLTWTGALPTLSPHQPQQALPGAAARSRAGDVPDAPARHLQDRFQAQQRRTGVCQHRYAPALPHVVQRVQVGQQRHPPRDAPGGLPHLRQRSPCLGGPLCGDHDQALASGGAAGVEQVDLQARQSLPGRIDRYTRRRVRRAEGGRHGYAQDRREAPRRVLERIQEPLGRGPRGRGRLVE